MAAYKSNITYTANKALASSLLDVVYVLYYRQEKWQREKKQADIAGRSAESLMELAS